MALNKKSTKRIICLFFWLGLVLGLSAQNSEVKKPSTLVFHVFYNDFNTAQQIRLNSLSQVLKNGQWSKIGTMQMGLGLDYIKGISKHLDLTASIDGSSTDYLFQDGSTNGSSQFLLESQIGFNLKLLSDHHNMVPYLTAGVGISSYNKKSGFYIPIGLGFQFNLFNEAFIFTNFQYRKTLSTAFNDHLNYSLGVGIPLQKTKKPSKVIPPVKKDSIPALAIIKGLFKNILITVIDDQTGLPLRDVEVIVSSVDGDKKDSTNDSGQVLFNNFKAGNYNITGKLNGIETTSQNITNTDFDISDDEIKVNLSHHDPRFTLTGAVKNKNTQLPENGVNIQLTNETLKSSVTELNQPNSGGFSFQLKADSNFNIIGKKANYISNIEKLTTKGLNRNTTLYVNLELEIEDLQKGQNIVLNNIYFETGRNDLNTSASTDLSKVIAFLNDNPTIKLEIQGHTDNVGSASLNKKLSQARADSVLNYLTKHGINKNRLLAVGYGANAPIADNKTADGRAKNRCVIIKIQQ